MQEKKESRSENLENEIKRAKKEMDKLEMFLKNVHLPYDKIEDFHLIFPEEKFPIFETIKIGEYSSDFYTNGIRKNQIKMEIGKTKISIICHFGSWGYEKGLLEMWNFDEEEPEGHLTAKQVIEKIKKIKEKQKNKYT